jgi:HlyD family secretion protein
MSQIVRRQFWNYWLVAGAMLCLCMAGLVLYLTQNVDSPRSATTQDSHQEEVSAGQPSTVAVEVVHPQAGMDFMVEQPGSVHAYEMVQLHAQVSGFLKIQHVDIGDRVKKGQVLAVIAVPELDKQRQRNTASWQRAKARVKQMEACVVSAKADHAAAQAAVVQADAAEKSAAAWVRFRNLQYQRMKDLFKSGSIEERLVDEHKERYEASLETERSAVAAIATSRANVAATAAKVTQAVADVAGAEAEVLVAQAEQERTQVLIDYATIKAPFDGEVSYRAFFPGDFVRSASEGANQQALLTVQRTDKFRVVVQVPDTAVPYLDKGDPAYVRIDSLPGRKFVGIVSRKSGSEDPNTRLMRIEVDLPNPTGEIGDGMYGKVQIMLDRFPKLLSIPRASVVKTNGRTGVFVVRDGRAHFVEVRLGKDNGTRITVLSGLHADDQVVRKAGAAGLAEGAEVQARLVPEPPTGGAP